MRNKNKVKYIIRLDDASPYMNNEKWEVLFTLFDRFGIKPIIAVIPDCKDTSLMQSAHNKYFWDEVRKWQAKDWTIALHGYQHKFNSTTSGIMGWNNYGEFAGVPLDQQNEMIRKGLAIFEEQNLKTNLFVAPAHSFDTNTIIALKQNSIDQISDGFFLFPRYFLGMKWIPQQLWKPTSKRSGIWTICCHPETSTSKDIKTLSDFIKTNHNEFIRVDSIEEFNKVTISDWCLWGKLISKNTLVKLLIKLNIKR